MFLFFWLQLFCEFRNIFACKPEAAPAPEDERKIMARMMIALTQDVLKNQNEKIPDFTRHPRQDNAVSAPFEIGYMTQLIQEHYRRMLDKWRSARLDIKLFYGIEMTLYLEEVEHLYWAIKHEVYMLHEVERKYKIRDGWNDTYVDPMYELATMLPTQRPLKVKKTKKIKPPLDPDEAAAKKKKKDQHNMKKPPGSPGSMFTPIISEGLYPTRKPKTTRLPLEYGWEMYEWNSDS